VWIVVCETKQEGSNQSDQSNEILSSERKKADLYYRSNYNLNEIYLSRLKNISSRCFNRRFTGSKSIRRSPSRDFFPAKTDDKRVYTTSYMPQKIIFAFNRLPFQNPRSTTVQFIYNEHFSESISKFWVADVTKEKKVTSHFRQLANPYVL
jgi:hypothetical protein